MAARQFGFVVARGLAVYLWFMSIGSGMQVYGYYLLDAPSRTINGLPRATYILGLSLFVIEFLAASFLWTTASKFAGPCAEETPKVASGDWVVKLVFSALGIFLIAGAISGLAQGIMIYGMDIRNPAGNFLKSQGPYLLGESIRFLIGLWLVLTNRFTRYRIAETTIGEPLS